MSVGRFRDKNDITKTNSSKQGFSTTKIMG